MGFVYRVLWILKALWIDLPETINILRKLQENKISGCPRKFYHRFMYIAPSSGELLPNFNLLFKGILRRFEVIFWCLKWECCKQSCLKNLWKFIQIRQYYTMALVIGLNINENKKYRLQNLVLWHACIRSVIYSSLWISCCYIPNCAIEWFS